MNRELNERIDKLKDNIIKSTQRLVQIKSVEAEALEGRPFGQGVNEALENVLRLAEILGLKNKNVDAYAGYAEIGEGKEMLGILCHLDVVPEGKNWTYPPYGGEIHDHRIYGRGTIDDKGPAIAALYALKAIKDCGIELKKRVRIIFGTNEESGWKGLKYYLEHAEVPTYGFSPDANFPVIHAEKGILTFKLRKEFKDSNRNRKLVIKSIKGGNAPNMVPDYCEAYLETDNLEGLKKRLNEFMTKTNYKLELVVENNEIKLLSQGVSAHGSLPEKGKNAISQLMMFFSSLDLEKSDLRDFITFYNEKIGLETKGESLGCNLKDEVSGHLSLNVGMINLERDGGEIVINIRYPVSFTKEKVLAGIKDKLKDSGILLEEKGHQEPLYVSKDDPLVTSLMKVYQEFTGDESEPIAIGGGTYARALEKAVAFGPLFPGQPELCHQRDEYIGIDDLIINTKIYASAIIELTKE